MSFKRALPKPTAEQQRRFWLIRNAGCVACRLLDGGFMFAEIHHQTVGGKHGAPQLGHEFTVGLCAWHHRGVAPYPTKEMEDAHGSSYARTPKAFRAEYGNDEGLLKMQNEMIGWTAPPVRERRRKRGSQCVASSKTVPRDGWRA